MTSGKYDIILEKGSSYLQTYTILDPNRNPVNLTGYEITFQFFSSDGTLLNVYDLNTPYVSLGMNGGEIYLNLPPNVAQTIKTGFFKLEIKDISGNELSVLTGNVIGLEEGKVGIESLTPYLRLRLGDTNYLSYRYLDEWLKIALILAVKNLQRFWRFKYFIDDYGFVSRNPSGNFTLSETEGIIEPADQNVIVLMAAIIVLEGSLEQSAWDAVSWKDTEISFSNLEAYRSRGAVLDRLITELNSLILPPTRKLARAKKGSLPGFKNNPYERDTKY